MEVTVLFEPLELVINVFGFLLVWLDGKVAFVLISDEFPELLLDFNLGESVFEFVVSSFHKVLEVVLYLLICEEAEVMFGLEEILFGKIDNFRVVKGDAFLLDGDFKEQLCNVRRQEIVLGNEVTPEVKRVCVFQSCIHVFVLERQLLSNFVQRIFRQKVSAFFVVVLQEPQTVLLEEVFLGQENSRPLDRLLLENKVGSGFGELLADQLV